VLVWDLQELGFELLVVVILLVLVQEFLEPGIALL
jgi:hypothetical protein